MALMVAAILLTVLSPLVVLSTSYRVQARRIDLATQAARSYIDGLRSDSIGPPSYNIADFSVNTPNVGVLAPATKTPDQGVDVGNCLDKNLNSLPDCNDPTNKPFLVIQSFRNRSDIAAVDSEPDGKNDPIPDGYCVGVRVYRGDAFDGGAPSETQPPKSGLSNTKYAPLVVMRAEIINQTSFQGYSDRITASGDNPCAPQPTPPP
jgi:type II secretory pathway pseudopilin PulG